MKLRSAALMRGRLPTMAIVALCAMAAPSFAQPKGKSDKNDKGGGTAEKVKGDKAGDGATTKATTGGSKKNQDISFEGMNFNGKMRTPQLLYFLERANEELERASLEKRSFIPEMVRSLEEDRL